MSVQKDACQQCRAAMPEALCEPAMRAGLEEHLAVCEACAAEYSDLAATVALLKRETASAPDVTEVWRRLEPQLDRIDAARSRWHWSVWATLAAAVLLALFLGWPDAKREAPATVQTASAQDADMVFAQCLNRARPLVLALANRPVSGAPAAAWRAERERAAQFADHVSKTRQSMAKSGSRSRLRLLSDLELLFLQIANSERKDYARTLSLVQTQIEREALLFQLSLYELRLAGS
jgi:hypothetical protein